MNTHILVPKKEYYEILHSDGFIDGWSKTSALAELVAESNEISLDEKDIEEKANLLYTKQSENPPYCDIKNVRAIEGYIQALKDLL